MGAVSATLIALIIFFAIVFVVAMLAVTYTNTPPPPPPPPPAVGIAAANLGGPRLFVTPVVPVPVNVINHVTSPANIGTGNPTWQTRSTPLPQREPSQGPMPLVAAPEPQREPSQGSTVLDLRNRVPRSVARKRGADTIFV